VEHPVTEQVARIYLSEAFSATHAMPTCWYSLHPLSADQTPTAAVAPEHITIVDSAESTAEDVAHQLHRQRKLFTTSSDKKKQETIPRLKFFATDSAEKFSKMGSSFWDFRWKMSCTWI